MPLIRSLAAALGLRSADVANDHTSDVEEFAADVQPAARTTTGVTIDSALSLSAVFRAVQIWATGTSQLTVDVFRGLEAVDPQPAIVRQPDLGTSRSAFIEETTTSLATTGNAYWRLHRAGSGFGSRAAGEVRTAEVLNPLLVTPLTKDATQRVVGYSYQGRTLKLDEVQHLKLLRVPGHITGLGPIQAARAELAGAIDLRNYATDWFKRGDVPPGVLTTEQQLNGEMAKAYKAQWYADTEGIKVLGAGLKFNPIMLAPKDAQWIESQNLSVLQVARMFGIPPRIMLASLEGSGDTYANLQQEDLSFVRWTLNKVLREIEEAWTAITPRGQTVRFNLDGVLRADTETRYKAHEIAIRAGFLSVDEVRAIEGRPPLPKSAATPDTDPAGDDEPTDEETPSND
ncbi:phage portal protein [Curtobacterium sp. PhB146]|uniref:phage portal protein n=1 Tax=Curtobacterium sp. PhB146 TaxID=2485187 RepID=UPI0010DC6F5E|nr:phage portal protein [Curtobacterium sp. PhB146]TCU48340.1 HK97 family phage portal protein [Curtobacterium sp. PhB146]